MKLKTTLVAVCAALALSLTSNHQQLNSAEASTSLPPVVTAAPLFDTADDEPFDVSKTRLYSWCKGRGCLPSMYPPRPGNRK